MYGIERRWPLPATAAIIGLATAARPVGVALLAPFAMSLWSSLGPGNNTRGRDCGARIARTAYGAALVVAACWGIIGYMAYQWWRFGEPLAFVKTQALWAHVSVSFPYSQRICRVITLAPLFAVYDAASPCYWQSRGPDVALFNINFANPVYFVLAAACLVFGARAKWLNGREGALAAALLLIPYFVHGDRTCMASQARFASASFPIYVVLGRLLARLPAPLAAGLCGVSSLMLALYSALFVSWYWS